MQSRLQPWQPRCTVQLLYITLCFLHGYKDKEEE